MSDTNVVLNGIASCRFTDVAADGPLFVAVIVYEMFPPGVTGSGASVLVTPRSARAAATVVVCVALLLPGTGSVVVVVSFAVFVITVPLFVPGLTFTTKVNVADAPLGSVKMRQFTVAPVIPTGGTLIELHGVPEA